MVSPSQSPPRIAFFIPSLECGGAERMTVNLATAVAEMGVPVDMVLGIETGEFLCDLPKSLRVINLRQRRLRNSVVGLARYLRQEKPFGLISRIHHANVVAVFAKKLARSRTRVVVTESSQLTATLRERGGSLKSQAAQRFALLPMMRLAYRNADAIVGVSNGVSIDLQSRLRLPAGCVQTIANPVVTSRVETLSKAPPPHRWLDDNGPPVVLSVGRLSKPKDHATLLQAFSRVVRRRPARLLILGEGALRAELENRRGTLDLDGVCEFPGHVANPYAFMAKSSLFALSSKREGSPNALVEAMACGCPVVSTNCDSGPSEILDGSGLGLLAPVGDPCALGDAMLRALSTEWDRSLLKEHVRRFAASRSARSYLAALGYPLHMLHTRNEQPARVLPPLTAVA